MDDPGGTSPAAWPAPTRRPRRKGGSFRYPPGVAAGRTSSSTTRRRRGWRAAPPSAPSPRELALLVDIGYVARDASICGLGQTALSAVQSAVKLGLIGATPGGLLTMYLTVHYKVTNRGFRR